jgi:hypothetical protein
VTVEFNKLTEVFIFLWFEYLPVFGSLDLGAVP